MKPGLFARGTMARSSIPPWLFRRAPIIARALTTVGGISADGIPYLAPEIQLLYKAKNLRPKDEADFILTLPALNGERRHWLKNALTATHPQHPWLEQLRVS
jgi:hypothetical protein